jgi:hypothetical protein
MPRKTVTLVSPEPACETYPLGMDVYETIHFQDAQGYDAALHSLIEKWMKPSFSDHQVLRLHRKVSCTREEDCLAFHGDRVSRKIGGSDRFYDFMDRVKAGTSSFREIVEAMALQEGDLIFLRPKLDLLFSFGYFQEHLSEARSYVKNQ